MNKLFSSRSVTTALGGGDKDKRPPPSPSKISHSLISSPIVPRLGTGMSSESRKPSFSSSAVTLVGSAAAATTGPTDILTPPQAPYATTSIYSSSPPNSVKEHHSRTHFLRVRKDPNAVTLSSASSNSKAISADGGSIYSFGPASPSTSVFAGSSKTKRDEKGDKAEKGDPEGGVDDWGFVRRAVEVLFEHEMLRTPVEDMNKFVVYVSV